MSSKLLTAQALALVHLQRSQIERMVADAEDIGGLRQARLVLKLLRPWWALAEFPRTIEQVRETIKGKALAIREEDLAYLRASMRTDPLWYGTERSAATLAKFIKELDSIG